MVVYICNPSTLEVEAGALRVQASKTRSHKKKKKEKKEERKRKETYKNY
jgi:hypothetical protein